MLSSFADKKESYSTQIQIKTRNTHTHHTLQNNNTHATRTQKKELYFFRQLVEPKGSSLSI